MNKPDFFTKPAVVLALAILVTFLWGSAFPAIKVGYESFSIADFDIFAKILFAGYRFFIAGIMVWVAYSVACRKPVLPQKRDLKGIVSLGLIQTAMQYAFFYIGLSHTTGVKGAVTYSVNSFLAVILAHFFSQNDRLTVPKTVGCLLGFGGVVIINLGGGQIFGGFSLMGEGMLIIAAFALALGALISRNMTKDSDAVAVTAFQMLLGGGLLIAIGLGGGAALRFGSAGSLWILGYLAFASAASFCAWTLLLKYNPVGKIAVYNFLMPVFGILLSGLVLGETVLTAQNLLAAGCVCAGIYIVNRRVPGGK